MRLTTILAVFALLTGLVFSTFALAEGSETKVLKGKVELKKENGKVTAVKIQTQSMENVVVPDEMIKSFEKLDGQTVTVTCIQKDGKTVVKSIGASPEPPKKKAPNDNKFKTDKKGL